MEDSWIGIEPRRQSGRGVSGHEKTIELSPEDADAHFNLGNLFFKLSYFNAAAASQRRAIKLNQDDVQAYSTLAKTLFRLDRLDEAEKYLRLALQISPNSIGNNFA